MLRVHSEMMSEDIFWLLVLNLRHGTGRNNQYGVEGVLKSRWNEYTSSENTHLLTACFNIELASQTAESFGSSSAVSDTIASLSGMLGCHKCHHAQLFCSTSSNINLSVSLGSFSSFLFSRSSYICITISATVHSFEVATWPRASSGYPSVNFVTLPIFRRLDLSCWNQQSLRLTNSSPNNTASESEMSTQDLPNKHSKLGTLKSQPRLVVLSALNQAILDASIQEHSKYIKQNIAQIDDIAYTLCHGQEKLPVKSFAVVSDPETIEFSPPLVCEEVPKLVMIFSGQGAQWVGMAKE